MPTAEENAATLRSLAIAAKMSEDDFKAACQHVVSAVPQASAGQGALAQAKAWVAGSEDPRDRLKRNLMGES